MDFPKGISSQVKNKEILEIDLEHVPYDKINNTQMERLFVWVVVCQLFFFFLNLSH